MQRKAVIKSDPRKKVYQFLKEAESIINSPKDRSDFEECNRLCLEAIQIAKASRIKELISASTAMAARSSLHWGLRNQATKYFHEARANYESLGDADAVLEMDLGLARSKITTGGEKQTLDQLHTILQLRMSASRKSSRIEEQTGGPITSSFFIPRSWEDRVLGKLPSPRELERNQQKQLAAIYDALGASLLVLREHHKAASFLEEELAICKTLDDRPLIANALQSLGYIHALLGNRVLALEYCQQGLKLSRQLKDKRGIAVNQRNLAQLYLHTGQVTLGKRLAMKSFEAARELGQWELASRALVTLTKYERLHGSLARAETLNSKALALLSKMEKGAPFYYFSLQQLLIQHARSPGKAVYAKLLQLHSTVKDLDLELQYELAQEIANVAEELHLLPEAVKWFRTVHEFEIERLNNEQRNALLSLKNEQELDRLAKQREVDELRVLNLEAELNAKARETRMLALHLAKKGSVLALLTDQLSVMKTANARYSAETIDAIIQLIESIRHKDNEYEQLEARAQLLHQDFLLALEELHPDITTAERRICVLLLLGLNSMDIANVLFTSVRTIESHALSIRKKLGIPKNTRLSSYLLELKPGL